MSIIEKAVFLDMAYNQPRDAIIALYAELERAQQERQLMADGLTAAAELADMQGKTMIEQATKVTALQAWAAKLEKELDAQALEIEGLNATVLELSTIVNAPAEAA